MTALAWIVRVLAVVVGAVLTVTLAARHIAPLPDVTMLVIIAVALWRGPVAGALAGLAGGWIVDLLPPGSTVLGTNALLYAAAGALAGRFSRRGPMPLLAVVATSALCAGLIEAGHVIVALAQGASVAWLLVGGRVLVTATAALVIVPLLLRLDHAVARRRYA